jgi:2-oxoacid dehydrogenases acyltransferase (catalytic domain)
MNAIWSGEKAQLLNDIDISVAVATDNGLITPIVKDAVSLGVNEISAAVKVRLILHHCFHAAAVAACFVCPLCTSLRFYVD